jgi:release factor glutamine methyltransferase
VTLRQAITSAREILKANKDIEDPFLESEVLLRCVLQVDRASFFLNIDEVLTPQKEIEYQQWIQRRLQGEPLAYIIHNREFYYLDFYVDTRVLIPRPETEMLVEQAIQFAQNHPVSTIADIGTGSGAIAVSLSVHLPKVNILATDISASALEVARINCQKHNVDKRISLIQGDLLDALPEPVDVLISNLPYVTSSEVAQMPSAKFEPLLALDGGEDGLDQVFKLCRQLATKIKPGGCVLLELGLGQSQKVTELLKVLFPSSLIEVLPDLAGINRAIRITLPE